MHVGKSELEVGVLFAGVLMVLLLLSIGFGCCEDTNGDYAGPCDAFETSLKDNIGYRHDCKRADDGAGRIVLSCVYQGSRVTHKVGPDLDNEGRPRTREIRIPTQQKAICITEPEVVLEADNTELLGAGVSPTEKSSAPPDTGNPGEKKVNININMGDGAATQNE